MSEEAERIKAELAKNGVKCERPFCDNPAVGTFHVARYEPYLCQEDIDVLNGSRTTWRAQLVKAITASCEGRFMRSQVPVWVDREDRLAHNTGDSEDIRKADR